MKTSDIKMGLASLWDFWEDFTFKFSHLASSIFLCGFEPRKCPLTLSVQTQFNKNKSNVQRKETGYWLSFYLGSDIE